jgi:hypothetical protein
MIASDMWTELLKCTKCGASGLVQLSQPENRSYDFRVEALPAGFKIVREPFGKRFYCQACNCPADTK